MKIKRLTVVQRIALNSSYISLQATFMADPLEEFPTAPMKMLQNRKVHWSLRVCFTGGLF
jgi:hypothetical protein